MKTRLEFSSTSSTSSYLHIETDVILQIPHYAELIFDGMIEPYDNPEYPSVRTLISTTIPFAMEMASALRYQRFCILNPNQAPRPRVFTETSTATNGYDFIRCLDFLRISPIDFDVLREIPLSQADFGTLMEIANLVKLGSLPAPNHEQLIKLLLYHFPMSDKPLPYPEIIAMLIPKLQLHFLFKNSMLEIYNTDSGNLLCSVTTTINRHDLREFRGFTRNNLLVITSGKTVGLVDPFTKQVTVTNFSKEYQVKTSRNSTKISLKHTVRDDVFIAIYETADGTLQKTHGSHFDATCGAVSNLIIDDHHVVVIEKFHFYIWNLKSDTRCIIRDIKGNVEFVSPTECGKYLICNTDKAIYLVDLDTNVCEFVLNNFGTSYQYQPVKSNDLNTIWFILDPQFKLPRYSVMMYEYNLTNRQITNCILLDKIRHVRGTLSISDERTSLTYATVQENGKSEWQTVSIVTPLQ